MAGESAQEKALRARAKAERLARYADQWEKGAEGESRTAESLAQIGPLWTVWHDLRWPGRRFANLDHLVVGPGGIFVIDSKNWSGSITCKDGVLRQNGHRRENAVAACADAALAVGELVPRYLAHVRPVLCFTSDGVAQGWARDVMLCSTNDLLTMLESRPAVLSPDEVADAVTTLRATLRSAAQAPPPRATAAGPADASHPVAQTVPRRPSWPARMLIRLIMLTIIAMVVALFVGFVGAVPGFLVAIASR